MEIILNIGMIVVAPLVGTAIQTYVLRGGGKKFKIIRIFVLYLFLINTCTFALSYARGVKEFNFSHMTVSYRLKYMATGCFLGLLALMGEMIHQHKIHQSNINPENRVRDSNFEVLRIIAMGMIALFHYVYGEWDYSSMGGYKVVIDVIWMFGELGVNVFALISGYFLIVQERPFKYKKVFIMWMQVLFYSLLKTIITEKMGISEINQTSMLRTIFPVTYKAWWYVSAYFVLYFLAPFLNIGLKALERKEYRRLLWGLLLMFSIWPSVIGIFDNNTEIFLFYSRLIWLIVIYCIAGYIRIYGICGERWTHYHWIRIHVITWIIMLIFIIFIPENGFSENLKMKNTYFWQPNSIIMVILSVSLFMIFSGIKMKENVVISYIGSCTFGMYLGSGMVIGVMIKKVGFHKDLVGAKAVFVDVICAFACMIMVMFAIELIRKQMEKIVMKFIDKICARIQKLKKI